MHPSGITKSLERENEVWDLSHEFMENCSHYDLARMYTIILLENHELISRVKELDDSESELAIEVIDMEANVALVDSELSCAEAYIQAFEESIWHKLYKFFNK
jgi:hypothetical protein